MCEMSVVHPSLSDRPRLNGVSAGSALSALTGAVRELSLAQRLENVQRVVGPAARGLTGADGATFTLREGDECVYVDEDTVEPLWKGKRFPLEASISGWAMLNRRHVVIEDIYADRRIEHDRYRHTFVKSLVIAPIRTMDPVGSIGVYWARRHRPTEREVGLTRALADSTAVALEHVQALDGLEPTGALSETDSATGLPTGRALDRALAAALHADTDRVCLALIDLDRSTDDNGQPVADGVLKSTASAWQSVLRGDDMLARWNGGQFAVLLPRCDAAGARLVTDRLDAVSGGNPAVIGLACWDGEEDAESLIGRADAALYEAKAAGRDRVVIAES
jgi:diguanylate cyclase (GGDEF)-like protein